MIVSDASGQMADLPDPSTRIPAAAGRASSIYGDRVREEQLIESLGRDGTVFVHLRKGLPSQGVSPLGVDGKPLAETTQLGTFDYGVQSKVQNGLARVRTDLDSFSQVEAYSLSLYAYLMTSHELPEPPGLAYEWVADAADVSALRAELHDPGPEYLKQLAVAGKRFRKASALDGTMKALELLSAVVVLVVLGLLAYVVYGAVPDDVPTWSLLVAFVVPAVLVTLYLRSKFPLKLIYTFADWLYTWLLPTLAAAPLWLSSQVTLWASPKFLAAGRIAKLPRKPPG
jgi:NTE family protein